MILIGEAGRLLDVEEGRLDVLAPLAPYFDRRAFGKSGAVIEDQREIIRRRLIELPLDGIEIGVGQQCLRDCAQHRFPLVISAGPSPQVLLFIVDPSVTCAGSHKGITFADPFSAYKRTLRRHG
jgi:hypothetical protein